jgi:hypothetical protein
MLRQLPWVRRSAEFCCDPSEFHTKLHSYIGELALEMRSPQHDRIENCKVKLNFLVAVSVGRGLL